MADRYLENANLKMHSNVRGAVGLLQDTAGSAIKTQRVKIEWEPPYRWFPLNFSSA